MKIILEPFSELGGGFEVASMLQLCHSHSRSSHCNCIPARILYEKYLFYWSIYIGRDIGLLYRVSELSCRQM